ncbi:hypothetical protein [Sporisorium scitamineum]|uniref:Uncharacterized protein n=1 Tax=Sporisorium scitamineum TaxID=49012 RepID=A0A0F7S023_9BASI|nr:hypothetical protein [Sporisorium scitamineum]
MDSPASDENQLSWGRRGETKDKRYETGGEQPQYAKRAEKAAAALDLAALTLARDLAAALEAEALARAAALVTE